MQHSISFETSAQVRQPLDVRATIQRRISSLNLWLNQKSNFYTLTCGFPVTRLLAFRVNLVVLCMAVAAVAVEQKPIASVAAALCAAWLVFRVNQTDSRQSRIEQEKKGGKK